MELYVSRYGNPELKRGEYTTVRISLGTPKWPLGYQLDGECTELMPFGLLNKYEEYEDFKPEYFQRLDRYGARRIQRQLEKFLTHKKDVVLLCYEDIRKGPDNWCHRTAFAEWMLERAGMVIEELHDPTAPKIVTPKPAKTPSLILPQAKPVEETIEQLRLF